MAERVSIADARVLFSNSQWPRSSQLIANNPLSMTATQAAPHDDVQQLHRLVGAVGRLRTQVSQRIVGQDEIIDGILTAVLAGGHALLIGVPGLAKTLMVQTVSEALNLTFNRVQFTPDLMPSDITGTDIIEED